MEFIVTLPVLSKPTVTGWALNGVVKTLKAQGCQQFFVATLEEALYLRQMHGDIHIGVLGGLFIGAEGEYVQNRLVPVLNSLEEIKRWKQHGHSNRAIIHFDTGMNRLGLGPDETKKLLKKMSLLDGVNVQMIMSHFACADEKDHPLTIQQRHDFDNIAQHFPDAQRCLNNSPGIFRCPDHHYDMVRPGIAMYGGNPTPEADNPMQAVAALDCRILQIRNVSKEESIGYGASHSFAKPTTTATIALGYADGFLRSNSSRAKVYWKDKACPVLGRVSMDLVTIDIGHLRKKPAVGDMVEILGPNQSVDDLAESAGTISYEILTSLGRRYQRHYING